MQNQALAVLEWHLAMGADEWVEETPQNRLIAPAPEPEVKAQPATAPAMGGTSPAPAARPAMDSTIPPFAPQPSPTPAAQTQTAPPGELIAKTTQLANDAKDFAALREAVMNFKELSICRSATQPVFAEGVETPRVLVIGEAPGADEDRRGVPFCGVSGQLLDKMLAAIDLSRQENVLITNSVFWRPPGNRTPSPEEIAICRPFVNKCIELIQPELLFILGGVAVRSVLQEETSIGRLRGKEIDYQGINTIVSYHPSYLLRQPTQKKLAWQDLLRIKTNLNKTFKIR